ncbi:SPRY domain-containing SOCS box protein 1-like isoform X1 [Rhynchophorus ferrugineus]|uniref:SPRY domain-containing SOCS box protein 1-like isoform X1 n=2 Tax=Rhynchophorus ferrugineus TaxID=354439 RepID=UPI003FCE1B8F
MLRVIRELKVYRGLPQLDEETPLCPKIDLLLDMPSIPKSYATTHAWNPDDCAPSVDVDLFEDTICRSIFDSDDTRCCRGRVGFTQGIHCWEIYWPKEIRVKNCVVGVATKEAPLHCSGKTNLVGKNKHSWGWDICNREALHDTDTQGVKPYPVFRYADAEFTIPDCFCIVLDMNAGTIAIVINGKSMGIMFDGLEGKTLYPIVNMTTQGDDVSMRYLGKLDTWGPPSLLHMCRLKLRSHYGKFFIAKEIKDKEIPEDLKEFVANPPQYFYTLHPSKLSQIRQRKNLTLRCPNNWLV